MAGLEASALGMFCDGRGISPAPLNHTDHLFSLPLFIQFFGYLSGHFQRLWVLLGMGKTGVRMGKAEKGTDDYNCDDQCYDYRVECLSHYLGPSGQAYLEEGT